MKKLVLIFLFLGFAFLQAANTDIQKQFEASKYMYSTFAKLEKQILSLPTKESFSTKKLDNQLCFNLMYEPLITYNSLNGKIEPLLGTLVEELSNNERGSINSTEQISAIHIDTLKGADGVITERLSFMVAKDKRNNPLTVRDMLQATRIAPSHVFEPLIKEKGLDEMKMLPMDHNPVVSGPYMEKDLPQNTLFTQF